MSVYKGSLNIGCSLRALPMWFVRHKRRTLGKPQKHYSFGPDRWGASRPAFLLGHPERGARTLLEKGLKGQAGSGVSKDRMSWMLSSCSYWPVLKKYNGDIIKKYLKIQTTGGRVCKQILSVTTFLTASRISRNEVKTLLFCWTHGVNTILLLNLL